MLRSFAFPVVLLVVTLVLASGRSAAGFEATWETDAETLKHFKIEDTKVAKAFGERAAVYLRFLPLSGKPTDVGFATKKNYLVCEGKDEHWEVEEVKRIFFDRRQGIAVYAFFFRRPPCDSVRFFVQPKLLD